MAISELYTNSATISTAIYSLPNNSTTPAAITTDGIIQVFIQVSGLQANDEYKIQILEKVAATQRVKYEVQLVGPRFDLLWVSPALILMSGWDVTMLKIAGTDRTIAWSIRSVA